MSNFSFVGKVISFNTDTPMLTSNTKNVGNGSEYGLVNKKDIVSSFLTDADKNEKESNDLVSDLEVNSVYPGGLLVNKIGKYRDLGKKKPEYKGLQPSVASERESKRML